MNLVQYKPRALKRLDIDRFFEDVRAFPRWETTPDTPAVDVKENDDHYLLEADLPGLDEKDLEVKVEGNLLTLSAKRNDANEEKKDGYILRERRSSTFCRSFVLPNGAETEKITAGFSNGVLHLTVPKAPEAKSRKIDITAN